MVVVEPGIGFNTMGSIERTSSSYLSPGVRAVCLLAPLQISPQSQRMALDLLFPLDPEDGALACRSF